MKDKIDIKLLLPEDIDSFSSKAEEVHLKVLKIGLNIGCALSGIFWLMIMAAGIKWCAGVLF